jgi:peptide/nickel transport system substrate-binding protein
MRPLPRSERCLVHRPPKLAPSRRNGLATDLRHHAVRRIGGALAAGCILIGVAVVTPADAKTLRWANRGDMQTTDPHSQNEGLTNNINSLVYEFLVDRDKKLDIQARLAESWQKVDDTTWRVKLRPGVKFHDGSPFTADDVVFSYERARADTSQLRVYANRAGVPKKLDEHTVELVTPLPNPTDLEDWATINIMSKAWSEKNRATKPQNYTQKEDMITAREANGTGPYMLKSRQPDVKTVLVKNPNWWGIKAGLFEGNVDEVVFTPINSDATRLAALISGEIDVINDPPPQDVPRLAQTPGIKVIEGVENRIVFIGMDQGRDELLYSNVKGKNPFKDKRVRQALYEAIDIDAIQRTTMRNLSKPTGALLPAPRMSTPDLEKRLPFDKAKAKALLADAGYPNGFEVTLDCPNNRYVNDEKICQALAAMWSQIGVMTKVNAMPRANYFPKLEKLDTSLYMLGWGGASTDAIFTLQPVLSTNNGKGDGDYNYGRYTNPKLDALALKARTEMNPDARLRFIQEALAAHNTEINHLPLHRQVIPWASRSNITVTHRADNFVTPYWVKMQ